MPSLWVWQVETGPLSRRRCPISDDDVSQGICRLDVRSLSGLSNVRDLASTVGGSCCQLMRIKVPLSWSNRTFVGIERPPPSAPGVANILALSEPARRCGVKHAEAECAEQQSAVWGGKNVASDNGTHSSDGLILND